MYNKVLQSCNPPSPPIPCTSDTFATSPLGRAAFLGCFFGEMVMTVSYVFNTEGACNYKALTARCNSVVMVTICGMCALLSLSEVLTHGQQEATPVKQSQGRLRATRRSVLFWVAATALYTALDMYVFADTDYPFFF